MNNPDADGGTAQLTVVWPPGPEASAILAQAIAATRAAGDITVTETVSSGPAATLAPGDPATTGDDYIAASPFSNGADDVHELAAEDGLTVITFVCMISRTAVSGGATITLRRVTTPARRAASVT